MKKIISWLLLGMLLCLCAGAAAAPGSAYLFTPEEREALGLFEPRVAAIGDTLYILMEEYLYQWRLGDEAPVLVSDQMPDILSALAKKRENPGAEVYSFGWLLSDGDLLYGFDIDTGKIVPILLEESADDAGVSKVSLGDPRQMDWGELYDEAFGKIDMPTYSYSIRDG